MRGRTSRLWAAVIGALVAVAAAMSLAVPAAAGTVTVNDEANVLNITQVQNQAAQLPVPIYIWTTTQDAASRSAFDSDVQAKVSSQFPIVLGINTRAHHEAIRIGQASGFTQEQANAAAGSANSAFDGVMRSRNDYTGAVTAALTSLKSSLTAGGGGHRAVRSHGGGSVLVGVIVLIILVVVMVILGRIFRGFRRSTRRMRMGAPMGYRGYGPPPGYGGYGPGYGPGYGGYGGGMGPGAAAGLGAAGGGFLGYELGKMAGENEQFRRDEMMGGYGDQGWGGGDGGGNDWVVGQDSDFGGGGDVGGGDFGGGGDSGGGGGGDW